MSNDKDIIKELEKITEKGFRTLSAINDNNTNYCYTMKDDKITELGLDIDTLNLNDKKLESLDKSIGKLQNLKKLNIKFTKNNELPECLKDLNNIEYLSLYNNNLTTLPDWFKEFKNLKTLNLENNNLTSLPEYFEDFINLEYLNLNKNDISDLPDLLTTLNNLKSFLLKNNFNLKWNGKNLEILKDLHKKGTKIEAPRVFAFQIQNNLPDEQIEIIREFEKENIEKEKQAKYANPINIKIVDGKVVKWRLFEYSFKFLPENFGVFKDLKSLEIVSTPLETLPDSFGDLINIEYLDLSKCSLKSLPDSFVNLTSISKLRLNNNQFNEIPTPLWALKELIELDLSNNPISDEEKNIIQKNPDTIREYLRKKATIKIFISHAVIDFTPYHIKELVEFLEKQKEISEVFFCEEDLAGNIDEWMLNTVQESQLILFIGTKKSVFNSPDCANELQLADKFSIPVIPIKGDDVEWPELAEINLSRELGLEFDKDNFDEFCSNLYKYIENFKREIDLMSKEGREKGITDIYERFRLMLNESINDLKKQIDLLGKRIDKLEK